MTEGNTKEFRKSKNTKASGLKSTFVVGDKLIMTSFGKGNKAYLEKEINGLDIAALKNPESFGVKGVETGFEISGRGVKSFTDNPLNSAKSIGEDMIGCKSELEEKFFGKTFSDNVHIQLIYNILDIEKILSVHINNIVYAVDNLERKDSPEMKGDFIASMDASDTYEDFINGKTERAGKAKHLKEFEEFTKNPRLSYFGDAFYVKNPNRFEDGKKKYENNKQIKERIDFQVKNKGKNFKREIENLAPELILDEKKLFYMLSLLGELRQITAHGLDKMYNFDKVLLPEFKEVLDKEYGIKINSLNRGFANNNKVNYAILFFVMDAKTDEQMRKIAKAFYEFTVKKTYKSMGFSIKKLRENILSQSFLELKSEKYDTMRQKVNTMLDFVIFDYYLNDGKRTDEIVNTLRSKLKEDEKEAFYSDEALRIFPLLENKIIKIKNRMNANSIKDAKKELSKEKCELVKEAVNEVAFKDDTNYFCKLMYCITKLLDGKEINDLLTTMINKFDNIASFLDVMNEYGLECKFKENYAMLNESAKITEDLKVINSFARMTLTSPDAKESLFKEAAEILGTKMTGEELSSYLKENVLGGHIRTGKHGFRNFIANNVIESSRFKYLVRYANPKKVRQIADNRDVVEFVLRQIDKEHTEKKQIERYYRVCIENKKASYEEMISSLTDIITGISFKQFENVEQGAKRGSEAEKDKVKKQAVISLYLTVLYLLVKNLVYINSRYYIAFHCLVRDAKLYYISEDELRNKNMNKLTEKLVNKKRTEINEWFSKLENPNANKRKRKNRIEKHCAYVENDMSHIEQQTLRIFRNKTEHLSPVRNINLYIKDAKGFKSYFELYHYLMQRDIVEAQKNFPPANKNVREYQRLVLEHNSYCKDFVKALCTPFGYNYPRFKNLSVEGLFDMHNTTGDEKDNHTDKL